MLHRHSLSPRHRESLDGFSRGDCIEACQGEAVLRGWVGGFSVGREKRISLMDENGRRIAQVALSKSQKIFLIHSEKINKL